MSLHAYDWADDAIRPGDLRTVPGRHLVALDLDGTTLHHDGHLAEVVRLAVGRAVARGHHVVVATGRAAPSALPVIRQLGLPRGYAVCSNGAVTIALDPRQPDGYRTVQTVTFDPAPVLRLLRGAWPDAHVAVEEAGLGFRVNAPFGRFELAGGVRVVSWQELLTTPATRVTFRSPTATAEDFVTLAERLGLHGVNYAVGYTAWLDISPDGVSKASALEGVRRSLRVPRRRTVAVGDQRNDIEMLRWAECGVAMAQAPLPVQVAARLVTGPVEADGLVPVLEALPPTAPRPWRG
ncbi:MAG TPA: HAD family hydrolase [Dermatophilaceae bacterium]|nr:HAD family hydrolase [Dermatophilaceae bacterium]